MKETAPTYEEFYNAVKIFLERVEETFRKGS